MQAELLRSFTIATNDPIICLSLRRPEFGPKHDYLFCCLLDCADTAIVLIVDSCELGVYRVDVIWRELEGGWDAAVG